MEKRRDIKCFPTKTWRNRGYMRELALPPITPQELAATGEALFGRDWRETLMNILNASETEFAMVECGKAQAPQSWRALLVSVAQEAAYRALEAASSLLSCQASDVEYDVEHYVGANYSAAFS